MAVGLRVIRGPDWTLDDDDGGEGHVGTVVEIAEEKIHVVWDGGLVSICRGGGGQGCHDLRVLDNATVGVKHSSIVCDECNEHGIAGMRWTCAKCEDFDLCSVCYFSDLHDCSHDFVLHETPQSEPVKVERRNKSMKMRVLGIFQDATVKRGVHWEWGDQDGGQGQTGRVLEVLSHSTEAPRSMVRVKWDKADLNIYRMGCKGKVDLQYVEEAPGMECYIQHLPVLDSSHYTGFRSQADDANITEGDRVCIAMGVEELRQVQKSRSGWAVGMAECIGKTGKVQGVAANGDAIVAFGNKKFRLFPGALKKVGNIAVGDRVRVLDDVEKVKQFQDGHGGYNEHMRSSLGKVGQVKKIDEDGDIVVKFGGRHWVYSPACLVPAPGEDIDQIEGDDVDDVLLGSSSSSQLLGLLAAMMSTGQVPIFMKAIAEKEESIALRMLRDDPKLAKAELQGLTALHVAANRGLLNVTKALVERGALLDERDKDGDTPLLAGMSNPEVAEFLIKKGCDVTGINKERQTVSHKAALHGHAQILKLLMARGADFNAQDKAGDTPLHDSISKSRAECARVILSWPRLDLRIQNKKGFSPLHYAALRDEPEIADMLVSKDPTLADETKDDGFTPLHVCACNDHFKVLQILLEKGRSNVEKRNLKMQAPIHVAVYGAYLKCTELLLKHGANVNAKDNMGNTPLHVLLSAQRDNDSLQLFMQMLGKGQNSRPEQRIQIVRLLLNNGADPDLKNDDGLTALDVCTNDALKETVKKIISERRAPNGGSRLQTNIKAMSQEGNSTPCTICRTKDAEVLFVPCGHRVICRECCPVIRLCPQCQSPIKNMFNKDGKSIKQNCVVM